MDFSKTQVDPHGVQKLLAILRKQQDDQESNQQQQPLNSTQPFPPSLPKRQIYNDQPRYGNGSSLLESPQHDPYSFPSSTLTSTCSLSTTSTIVPTFRTTTSKPILSSATKDPRQNPNIDSVSSSSQPIKNLQDLDFNQTLPILSSLANDSCFINSFRQIQNEQNLLEHSLFKLFQNQQSTSSSTNSWNTKQSILNKWDGIRRSQQKQLQQLGVPCFYVTDHIQVLKKQKKILNVLGSMMEE